MKAYTSVPRDLTRVKEKLLFNLTKRQLVCFGLAAVIGLPSYFFVKEAAGSTVATLCMVFIMIPMFLIAMYEKNGQPLEVLFKQFIQAKYLRVKERPYRTNNRYAVKKGEADNSKGNFLKQMKKKLMKNSPETAQQSIPYQKMYRDGICKVTDTYYSKTIQFQDRNYQILNDKEKELILDDWGSFLKLFGNSVQFEFTFMSLPEDKDLPRNKLHIPIRFDGLDKLREEHAKMLKSHAEAGNKGLEDVWLLSFGLEAKSLKEAKMKLEHIEKEVLERLEKMNVEADSLCGAERLKVMHRMLHIGDDKRFIFDWSSLYRSGLNTKDYIAPTSFKFDNGRSFQMGAHFAAVSYLSITASELNDEVLKEFLDTEYSQIASMHVQTVDKATAIKMVKRTITEIDRSKIEEQKKAVKAGYDMDIMPTDLSTYGKDARKLLNALQSEDESLLLVTFLIVNTGRTKNELEENISRLRRIVQQKACELCRLDYQQEQGFMSSLPLAYNQIEIQRALTTSSTAIFIPFTAQEIFHESGAAIYYGIDQLTNGHKSSRLKDGA